MIVVVKVTLDSAVLTRGGGKVAIECQVVFDKAHLQRFELHGRVVCRVCVDQPILLGGVVLHLRDPKPLGKEPSRSFPLLADTDIEWLLPVLPV